jgi:hypothetical protein
MLFSGAIFLRGRECLDAAASGDKRKETWPQG